MATTADSELNATFKLPASIQPVKDGEHIRGQERRSDARTKAALHYVGAPQPVIAAGILRIYATYTNQQHTHAHAI